jgi:hypothetical protein
MESKVEAQELLSDKRRWRKLPDARLKDFIAWQKQKRDTRGGRKLRSRLSNARSMKRSCESQPPAPQKP